MQITAVTITEEFKLGFKSGHMKLCWECKKTCNNTYKIEVARELKLECAVFLFLFELKIGQTRPSESDYGTYHHHKGRALCQKFVTVIKHV